MRTSHPVEFRPMVLPNAKQLQWTDGAVLEVLRLADEGLTYSEIAKAMGIEQPGKNLIAGLMNRFRDAPCKDGSPCQTEHDGTLDPDWWREGLRRRAP